MEPKISSAAYVRVSTEHQQYSIENQIASIQLYADNHGLDIVNTYVDDGKSGLTLDGRKALLQLLFEIQNNKNSFKCILVYDVSRWGRFQDTDESAYYEYCCKKNGVEIIYCMEQFTNNEGPWSALIKSLKRAMAGEYSRELSIKVSQGQRRLVQLGFHQGGQAGYGLRRMLVDHNGSPKGILALREKKSLQTDRVILVPGPPNEIETVRWIYKQFINHNKSLQQIASELNAQGIRTDFDREWNKYSVRQILRNEKYIGNNVHNRISFKLRQCRTINPPEAWSRKNHAFHAVIDNTSFQEAQVIMARRPIVPHMSNNELLDVLRTLYQKHGTLSSKILGTLKGGPSPQVFRRCFGSLLQAYHLVGFDPTHDYSYVKAKALIRTMYSQIIDAISERVTRNGGHCTGDYDKHVITFNGEFSMCIGIGRCELDQSKQNQWVVHLPNYRKVDLALTVRMNSSNDSVKDYFLLPAQSIKSTVLRLKEINGFDVDVFRFDTLEYLFKMANRASLDGHI